MSCDMKSIVMRVPRIETTEELPVVDGTLSGAEPNAGVKATKAAGNDAQPAAKLMPQGPAGAPAADPAKSGSLRHLKVSSDMLAVSMDCVQASRADTDAIQL